MGTLRILEQAEETQRGHFINFNSAKQPKRMAWNMKRHYSYPNFHPSFR